MNAVEALWNLGKRGHGAFLSPIAPEEQRNATVCASRCRSQIAAGEGIEPFVD